MNNVVVLLLVAEFMGSATMYGIFNNVILSKTAAISHDDRRMSRPLLRAATKELTKPQNCSSPRQQSRPLRHRTHEPATLTSQDERCGASQPNGRTWPPPQRSGLSGSGKWPLRKPSRRRPRSGPVPPHREVASQEPVEARRKGQRAPAA